MGYKVGFDTNSEVHKTAQAGVPKWRICTRGINLIGICKNEGCEAKGKKVVVQMPGITEYNFTEQDKDKLICPMCKKSIERTNNVVFYKCKFKFQGLRLDFETYEEKEDGKEGDSWNGYTVFNPVSDSEDVDDDRWLELKVTVEIRKD